MRAPFLLLLLSVAATAEITESLPTVRSAKDEPVVQVFGPSTLPRFEPTPLHAPAEDITLRLEVLDTVTVNTPFRIILRAYDRNLMTAPEFSAPVTFESIHGVVPIISRARWINGILFDTLIITRPGRNIRLTAIAGSAMASLHIDVAPPPLERVQWLSLAERHLVDGKFDDAIFSLKKASGPDGDAAIERRIGRLYLERGMYQAAEEHFLRAIRLMTR